MIYNSLPELIKAVREHTKTGHQVIHADQPKRLLLGWMCPTTKREFQCKISSIKGDLKLAKYFSNHVGAAEFLDYLNWKKLKL